jgi:uncharacterized membrane protein YphA (DoxX/SURF4 family)
MKEVFLAGRLLFGGYLLFSGAHHFRSVTALSFAASAAGVPMATTAVLVAGVLLIIAGLSFLFGIYPRVGVLALALFLIPVTLFMHAFWREAGLRRVIDVVNFSKNVGLLGAGLMLVAIPEPWPYSVLARGHHVRRHASV